MAFNIGDKVTKITDGKTGSIKNSMLTANGIKYQVQFDNGEAPYLSEDILEKYQEIKTPLEAFSNFQFRGIDDYRRLMSFERLKGELTNMFYSMNNTLTEYLPHQFLPVTKFLQSPEERILIADEVGLGKTVEAMYIWKELEARRNARKLLVVCPAALREKWKKDMENLFDIHAEIVKADKLLDTFHSIEKDRHREQFAYICSLESIRTKKTESYDNVGNLNRAFEEFATKYSEYAFDLVIIDEAHYLRNRETANFKTGVRLRDISESLILLSATPIQTASENLYSIMNLLAPERFENEWAFDHLLKKDAIFIKLANCLQRHSSTIEDFDKILNDNSNSFPEENELIEEIKTNKKQVFSSTEKRMQYSEELRSHVFYSNLFNRTRRRFVFENTAKRKPNAVKFSLSKNEMDIYNSVTQLIRNMSKGNSKLYSFALIARQRQMASCLPAAFKDWQYKLSMQDIEVSEEEALEVSEFDISANSDDNENSNKKLYENLKPFYQKIAKEFKDVRYEDLKRQDSKYSKFLISIKEILEQNPYEKIIVFSFFRGTNEYLEERLREDGISSVAIKGGMGSLKDDLLEDFKTNKNINILISSEVGSEGLDLQFASVEYNYDLPWNPMRLEQRIGRIDRIGQKAEILRIYNLYCPDTIEDRILNTLYERVKIFENSIGDMEDIVGQPIQELSLEILNPELNDEDRKEKAEQKISVLVTQRLMNNKLEEESGNLTEYRDLVLNSIETAKTNKRCIDSNERIFIVKDFLKNYYPGTRFVQSKENLTNYVITLSDDAILDYRNFRQSEHNQKNTSIDTALSGDCILAFHANKNEKRRRNIEIADLDHPIFDWIKWKLKRIPMTETGCSAITMTQSSLFTKGKYIYYIQKWQKNGIEKASELKYFLISVPDNTILRENISEQIMNTAITKGSTLFNAEMEIDDSETFSNSLQLLINHAWKEVEIFENNYKRKSKHIYNKQVDFVNFTADKKIETIKGIIETLKAEGKKQSVIHMNEKRIEKIDRERNLKLTELEKNKFNDPIIEDFAVGFLIIS